MSLQIEINGIYGGNLWKNSRFKLVNLVFRNLKLYIIYLYLKEFFTKHGLNYATAAINQSTNKRYWLFEGTDKLNDLLNQWRLNK